MTREEVVTEARLWVDTPYRRKGRTRSGIDCLGLLIVIAGIFGVPHVDHADYSDWPDPRGRILRELGKYLKLAPINGLLPGTIGVFNQRVLPVHTGIFSSRDGFPHVIHARLDVLRVVEEPYRADDVAADFRLIRLYAFPDLEL